MDEYGDGGGQLSRQMGYNNRTGVERGAAGLGYAVRESHDARSRNSAAGGRWTEDDYSGMDGG